MTVVNHTHQYIYFHEPYTGGRATEEALMQHPGSHNCNGRHHITVAKMLEKGFVTKDQLFSYVTFRTIRHPIDWLVTAWCLENQNRTPFMAWVRTCLSHLVQDGTIFWRYATAARHDARQDQLQDDLNLLFDLMQAPRVTLKQRGVTDNKPHWQAFLTVQDVFELEDIIPDIRRYGYQM